MGKKHLGAYASSHHAWHDDYVLFQRQIQPYLGPIRSTARRILGDDDSAADAVQEALIALWKSGPVPDHLQRWLLRTVVHRSLHARRTRTRRAHWEDQGGHAVVRCPMCDPSRELEVRELIDELEHILSTLPPDQREALELREIECLDYQQIADRLGVPMGTVRSRINRARAKVRESGAWYDVGAP